MKSTVILAPTDDRPVRVVAAGRTVHRELGIREAFAYRELFLTLVWRNLGPRYRQMALGVLWVLFEPLAQMILISVFFGMLFRLPSDGIPYPVFVLSALLPWTFFSRVIQDSSQSLHENMGLISKIYFPRILLPLASVIKTLVDTGMMLLLLLVVMLLSGYSLTPQIIMLPTFLILGLILGLGIGMLSAVVIVRFRDITYVITLGLQVWMYLTPIVYSPSLVPDWLRPYYQINPTYWMVEGLRWSLLGKPVEFTWQFTAAWMIALTTLVIGWMVFRRHEQETVDYE
ncbi:phosphate ABC transporter permease [Paramagnetospirillum kuznetsovii]|uniref:Transport permease protein n=1 Tax=Paramagnetospirillum kuznetsovii TaxID=2053833 RepID=A0A364NXR3_9PROT|nr:ABC transporter permease [Paramagnetospirillum kuznetsovii]RAU21833.1 phosphate ABC transporter permease [Paramagnetospirillum kuznetsovii]